jgi:uncharacterized protein
MTVPRFWREQPQRYRLVGTQCPECERVYFPPRSVCPTCRRESVGRMRPRQLSGRGKLLTYTVVYQPGDGFEMQVPYVMGIVELEEGGRVMSQIINVDPQAVHTGLPVEACFRRIREDGKSGVIYYGYKFRPIRARAAREPAARAQVLSRPKGAARRPVTVRAP